MRRPLPSLRGLLVQSSQGAALAGIAVLAMAMAPAIPEPAIEPGSLPELPPVTAVAEPAGPVTRTILFEEPVRGFPINSRFGMRRLGGERGARMHKGVDIAAPTGTAVYSSAEGEVLRIGRQPDGYGNFIEVLHPTGKTTLYAHLSRIDVASGDRVMAGERIGLVGSTGYSTGPHLHFEVRRDGVQVNPSRVVGRSFEVAVETPVLG